MLSAWGTEAADYTMAVGGVGGTSWHEGCEISATLPSDAW